MNKSKRIFCLSFDLKEKLLDKYYDKSNSNAYREIKDFMIDNGFTWIQKSMYKSSKPITKSDCVMMLTKLNEEKTWLQICTSAIQLSIVDSMSMDVMDVFQSNYDIDKNIKECSEKVQNKQKKKSCHR